MGCTGSYVKNSIAQRRNVCGFNQQLVSISRRVMREHLKRLRLAFEIQHGERSLRRLLQLDIERNEIGPWPCERIHDKNGHSSPMHLSIDFTLNCVQRRSRLPDREIG